MGNINTVVGLNTTRTYTYILRPMKTYETYIRLRVSVQLPVFMFLLDYQYLYNANMKTLIRLRVHKLFGVYSVRKDRTIPLTMPVSSYVGKGRTKRD